MFQRALVGSTAIVADAGRDYGVCLHGSAIVLFV